MFTIINVNYLCEGHSENMNRSSTTIDIVPQLGGFLLKKIFVIFFHNLVVVLVKR